MASPRCSTPILRRSDDRPGHAGHPPRPRAHRRAHPGRRRRRPRHVLRPRHRAPRSPLRRAALGAHRARRRHPAQTSPTAEVRAALPRGLVAPRPGHRRGRRRHGAAGQSVHAGPRSRPRPRGPTLRRQRRQRSRRQLRHPVRAVRAGRRRAARRPARRGCTIAACRTACDAYAGTARTALAAAVTRLINDNGAGGRNQTGLAVADALRFARALADAEDPLLFGDTCAPVLDQTAPRITFGATPAPGALVRGAVEITAVATDDTRSRAGPHAARAHRHRRRPGVGRRPRRHQRSRCTHVRPRRPLHDHRHRPDAAGNRATATLPLVADNTPPVVTVSATGFLVDGTTWWTTAAAPSLTGTASDLHAPVTVRAYVLGAEVAATVAGPGGWSLTVPATAIPRWRRDRGARHRRRRQRLRRHRRDLALRQGRRLAAHRRRPGPRLLRRAPTTRSRSRPPARSTITLPTGAVTLGTVAPPSCPTIRKYAYLTAVAPGRHRERAQPGRPGVPRRRHRHRRRARRVDVHRHRARRPGLRPVPRRRHARGRRPRRLRSPDRSAPRWPGAVAAHRRPGAVSRRRLHRHLHRPRSPRPAASVARCFTYRPIGPPMKVVLQAREAVRSSPSPRCATTTSSTTPRPTRASPSSERHRPRRVLELWVENVTADPAYVTFAAPRPPVPTVSRTFRTHANAIASRVVAGPTCDPSPVRSIRCAAAATSPRSRPTRSAPTSPSPSAPTAHPASPTAGSRTSASSRSRPRASRTPPSCRAPAATPTSTSSAPACAARWSSACAGCPICAPSRPVPTSS
jgi:hypothetical protein